MALIIGESETRIIPVTSKQPMDHDKIREHKFDVTFDVIDRDEWRSMTERWAELNEMGRLREMALKNGDPVDMSDDEIKEAREPIYKIAGRYIRNIGPLTDENKQPVEFTDSVKDGILALPWLQSDIADAFMAVQNGMTMADYRKNRAKN